VGRLGLLWGGVLAVSLDFRCATGCASIRLRRVYIEGCRFQEREAVNLKRRASQELADTLVVAGITRPRNHTRDPDQRVAALIEDIRALHRLPADPEFGHAIETRQWVRATMFLQLMGDAHYLAAQACQEEMNPFGRGRRGLRNLLRTLIPLNLLWRRLLSTARRTR
jgi:hypothetical protein